MPSPPQDKVKPARAEEQGTGAILNDRWLCIALLTTAAVYVALIFIRPTGENWGRGWNLVAFLIYSAPTALIAGSVALWRRGKTSGHARKLAGLVALGAFVFPVVCIVAIRAKA